MQSVVLIRLVFLILAILKSLQNQIKHFVFETIITFVLDGCRLGLRFTDFFMAWKLSMLVCGIVFEC